MIRIITTLLLSALLSGCAAGALTLASAGAGVGMATGVDHTLSGTVYKTFTAPVNEVRLATLRALDRMDMKLAKDERSETGWQIEATASQRVIEIELERLSRNTSRMKVTANQGDFFFKDSSTATEIITQASLDLDAQHSRRASATEARDTRRTTR